MSQIERVAPNLPHLPVEDALLRAKLGLPCAYLLFGGWPIEEAVDRLHGRWEGVMRDERSVAEDCGTWHSESVTRRRDARESRVRQSCHCLAFFEISTVVISSLHWPQFQWLTLIRTCNIAAYFPAAERNQCHK